MPNAAAARALVGCGRAPGGRPRAEIWLHLDAHAVSADLPALPAALVEMPLRSSARCASSPARHKRRGWTPTARTTCWRCRVAGPARAGRGRVAAGVAAGAACTSLPAAAAACPRRHRCAARSTPARPEVRSPHWRRSPARARGAGRRAAERRRWRARCYIAGFSTGCPTLLPSVSAAVGPPRSCPAAGPQGAASGESHGRPAKQEVAFQARHAPLAQCLATPGTAIEPTTGEVHLRHHISPTGFYRGRKVLKTKADA